MFKKNEKHNKNNRLKYKEYIKNADEYKIFSGCKTDYPGAIILQFLVLVEPFWD